MPVLKRAGAPRIKWLMHQTIIPFARVLYCGEAAD